MQILGPELKKKDEKGIRNSVYYFPQKCIIFSGFLNLMFLLIFANIELDLEKEMSHFDEF